MYRKFKCFLILSGLGGFILVITFAQIIPSISAEIAEAQGALSEVNGKVDQAMEYQRTHENYEVYEKEVLMKEKIMQMKIPERLATGEFVAEVQRIASQQEIEIVKVEPEKAVQADTVYSQSIDIIVRGNYFSVLKLLRELEQGKLFIHVSSLSLKGENGQVECHIVLNIYADKQ